MRLFLIAAALLLAAPAFAQMPPEGDEYGCEATAARLDAAERAKQKPSPEDTEEFEKCVGFFGCEESAAAAMPKPYRRRC